MPGNGHVRFGPEVAGKGPAPSGHLAGGLPAPRTGAARFLGYEVTVQHCNTKITGGQRTANGGIALRVPPDMVRSQCARYRKHGKPWHRSRLQNLDDYDIVRTYGAEFRGVVNYYLLAQDVSRLHDLQWNAETSMLKTLGAP